MSHKECQGCIYERCEKNYQTDNLGQTWVYRCKGFVDCTGRCLGGAQNLDDSVDAAREQFGEEVAEAWRIVTGGHACSYYKPKYQMDIFDLIDEVLA